jgi:hypothetical protein
MGRRAVGAIKKATLNDIGIFKYVIFYAGEMAPKKATANDIGIF